MADDLDKLIQHSQFHFQIYNFPFSISRFHFPFPMPHSLFPIPHSPFPIPHSPFLVLETSCSDRYANLKGLCHEDFAILGQFCAKIIT